MTEKEGVWRVVRNLRLQQQIRAGKHRIRIEPAG
jgi:hypothetical protein